MAGNTLAEFFGHVIFSFTRSVAEHYNFDEAEHNLELFGHNPLDDTGKEWYCQPVDELIYQEYSNEEAKRSDYLASSSIPARFIDACSTEETDEQTQQVGEDDRSMTWKQLRPSIWRTVWKSMYFGFFLSVLSAVFIGIVSILVYYLSFQTQLACLVHPKDSIPNKLQWVRAISDVLFVFLYYIWFFLNVLFYFRPYQITGLKLRLLLTCLTFYCINAVYVLVVQALSFSHFKLTPLQVHVLPGNVLFFLCLCIQVYIIISHFCGGPRKKQFLLFIYMTVPCVLTLIVGVLQAYYIYPAYNKADENGKKTIAIFAPLITVVLRGVSRVCVQRLWQIGHPGTSFVLLAPLYCGSAVMLRLLQVDMKSLESIALIGVIHGMAEVVERSTMVLIDHIYNQLLQRTVVRCGDFRTPRRERLAADIAIMGMLYEPSAIISVNGFLHLYPYFHTSDKSPLQLFHSFAITTSVALVIEWFFTSVSLAIETRYQNMPVMAVWRRKWKKHIAVAILNAVVISVWLSSSLIVISVIQERFIADPPKDFCQMPFHSV